MGTQVVWYRNDLRVHDHRPLWNACRAASEIPGDDVVPIYIVEPQQFGKTSFGFAKCGPHRFLDQSLRDLDRQLRSLGASLHLLLGPAEDVFEQICKSRPVSHVYFYREIATEEREAERRVVSTLRRLKVEPVPFSPDTLCEWDSLPLKISDVPELFNNFRRQVEKRASIVCPLPAPSAISSVPHRIEGEQNLASLEKLGEDQSDVKGDARRATMRFEGGETAGRNRVAEYIWKKDLLKQAKDYDPDGEYVKHWLPELSEVPADFVHGPWRMSDELQQRSRCRLGRDYPEPMVDLFESAERNRQRYEASTGKSRCGTNGLVARN